MALQNKRGAWGYVYFVKPKHLGGPIKIGYAKDPGKRLADLQVGSFHELEILAAVESDDAAALERRLHKKLKNFWHRGEWFAGAPEVYRAIMELDGLHTPLGEYKNGDWTLRNLKTLPYRPYYAYPLN